MYRLAGRKKHTVHKGHPFMPPDRFFIGHDRIRAARQHRSGHHFDAGVVGGKRERKRACRLHPGHTEAPCSCQPSVMPERIAVHRHPVKWRQRAIRREYLAQHAAVRPHQRTVLSWQWRDGFQHLFFGFSDGKHDWMF